MKKKFYRWEWKDGNGNYWTLAATDSGERQKIQGIHSGDDEGDAEWHYEVFLNCGYSEPAASVHKGLFVGQQGQPPKLRLLLQDWLNDVAGVVVDGAIHGQKVE